MNLRLPLAACIALLSFMSNAQVGIGTTNPDPSSAFDVSSTTKGLLAPRMETTQRTAIVNPAEGLLVFDTDEDAFYYYDSNTASWVEMLTDIEKRDNYVLVKSEADFPTPSGGIITLDENTYYEINGTIILTNSINLNNAYISGLDANEDIIISAGTVFSGSLGGSIRNITITGGGTAFNLVGSGLSSPETILLQNTIVANMSSVGTISGFGLFFGNIVQFVGNSAGITYSNIGNLLLNNQGWFDSNSGTFETLTGTFGLVEKVSGFSVVPSGAVGMDVSSNPVVGNGVLNGTVFSGSGSHVEGYTIGSFPMYNFTNDWTVNGLGIPSESDDVSTGYIYFASENNTVTNVVSDNVPVKMVGTTTSGSFFRMSDDGGLNNRIKYIGSQERNFKITCSATVERSSNGSRNIYSIMIYKNGAVVPSIIAEQTFENGVSKGNFTMLGVLSLNTNDYIEVYVSTDNSNIDPTVKRFNLVID